MRLARAKLARSSWSFVRVSRRGAGDPSCAAFQRLLARAPRVAAPSKVGEQCSAPAKGTWAPFARR